MNFFAFSSRPPRSGAGRELALLCRGSQDTTAPLPAGTSQQDGRLASHFREQFRWYLWSSLGSQHIAPGNLSPALGYQVPGDCSWDCPADPSQKKLVKMRSVLTMNKLANELQGNTLDAPREMMQGNRVNRKNPGGVSRALWKLTGFRPEAFTSSAFGGWSWRRQLPIP